MVPVHRVERCFNIPINNNFVRLVLHELLTFLAAILRIVDESWTTKWAGTAYPCSSPPRQHFNSLYYYPTKPTS